MIIAISGKIGSGKDTVGRIIQYLTCPAMGIQVEFKDWINNPDYNNFKPDWKIVKFADALKDIVCILTGCTREQLEDADFKDSLLNEEWDAFEDVDPPTRLTYREMLQYLGTDLLRNQLHKNTWVNALFSKYKCPSKDAECSSINGVNANCYNCEIFGLPNWIITDCRFLNEAKAVKNKHGVIIRVNRPNPKGTLNDFINADNIHPSETALDYYDFDYTINNDGTIEELIDKVKEILIKRKLI